MLAAQIPAADVHPADPRRGIPRVVIAWLEPSLFVADCQGKELLEQAGAIVTEMPEMAEAAKEPDKHLRL